MCGGSWRNSIYAYDHECDISGIIPPPAIAPLSYQGSRPRLVVPTVRTSFQTNEPFVLKAMVISKSSSGAVVFYARPLGSTKPFTSYPMTLVTPGRQVYSLALNPFQSDFEYYIQTTADGVKLVFPVEGYQTVVISP